MTKGKRLPYTKKEDGRKLACQRRRTFQRRIGPIMDERSIKRITDEVCEILLRKNEEYGGASFDLGLNGNMVHLWDKVRRYRNLVEKGSTPSSEGIEDTLRDIIGYAIIGLHILENEDLGDKRHGKT